jgi:hypothetical protein
MITTGIQPNATEANASLSLTLADGSETRAGKMSAYPNEMEIRVGIANVRIAGSRPSVKRLYNPTTTRGNETKPIVHPRTRLTTAQRILTP